MARNDDFLDGIGDRLRTVRPSDYGYDDSEDGPLVETPLPFDHDVFNVVDAGDRYRAGASRVTEEDLDSRMLRATQEWVDRGVLSAYARDAGRPIEVVRYRGKDFVMDGHHRAAAAYLTGRRVRARVFHWEDPS